MDRWHQRSAATSCALCGSTSTRLFRSARQIAIDLEPALARGVKLMHSSPVDVYGCEDCGTIFRDPARVADLEAWYREDRYEVGELDRLWRNGLDECRRQRRWLTSRGLHAGSSVLEIGSYVGSFLSFARERGCDAVGVDVGRAVRAFARGRGLDVRAGPFSAGLFHGDQFDSVWILNCFEQLPDVVTVLHDATTVLKPGGRIVLRTPNADFIRAAYHDGSATARAVLDTNALLGVPFAKCFTPACVGALLAGQGVGDVEFRGHELGTNWRTRRSSSLINPWVDISGVLVIAAADSAAGHARTD
jgi:SAM-dependent methyltransferase